MSGVLELKEAFPAGFCRFTLTPAKVRGERHRHEKACQGEYSAQALQSAVHGESDLGEIGRKSGEHDARREAHAPAQDHQPVLAWGNGVQGFGGWVWRRGAGKQYYRC